MNFRDGIFMIGVFSEHKWTSPWFFYKAIYNNRSHQFYKRVRSSIYILVRSFLNAEVSFQPKTSFCYNLSLSWESSSSIPFSTMSLISLSFHLFFGLPFLFFLSIFLFITSCGILLLFIRWTYSYHCNLFLSIVFILFVLTPIHALASFTLFN